MGILRSIDAAELYMLIKNLEAPVKIDTQLRAHNIFIENRKIKPDPKFDDVNQKWNDSTLRFVMHYESFRGNEDGTEYPDDIITIGAAGKKIEIEDCIEVKEYIECMLSDYYDNGRTYFYEGVDFEGDCVSVSWGS